MMTKLHERDAMSCGSCGNEERASEGYPCADCGVFICLICDLRGVTRCRACQAKRDQQVAPAKPVA
jgi:hypothetical protein